MRRRKSSGSGVRLLETAYLPLYSQRTNMGCYVPPKNNLNIRFASGRPRNIYEVGIPIPAEFRYANPDFFPGRFIPFSLVLPDGTSLSAMQCQDEGKALMSNPNSDLGEWLIDTVLQIDPEEVITYDMLIELGVDSVKICKMLNEDSGIIYYTIEPAEFGSYERFR